MCGCALAIWMPAVSASWWRRRVAACRSIRGAAAVEQDRPAGSGGYCPVDGPAGRGRQRDQDGLGALAAYPQDPVAVLLAEVGGVGAGGFEDPQAEQAEHGHRRA